MESSLFNQIGSALGILGITAVGAAGVAYWLFRTFAEKWISNKFNQQLSVAEHAHRIELQNLKLDIDRLLDRSVNLHQREFEVLPELWALVVAAFELTQSNISTVQIFADVDQMTDVELTAYLKNLNFEKWKIDKILGADDKKQTYQRLLASYRGERAQEALKELQSFRKKNGIFLQSEIKQDFEKLDTLIYDAFREGQLEFQSLTKSTKRDARNRFESDARPLLDALEQKVHNRLWN